MALDESYLRPEEWDVGESVSAVERSPQQTGRRWVILAGALALTIGVVGAWWAVVSGGPKAEDVSTSEAMAEVVLVPPDRERHRGDPLDRDPEWRARVVAGLEELAGRFGVGEAGGPDPAELMERIAGRLRYRGPLLTVAERQRLRSEPGAGRSRALAWDEQIRRFLPDRPLPPDFDGGPLRWQLETLAWSFHVALDPRLAAAEVPHALGHALAVEGSVRPNPLAGRYPALAEYARFLERLPKR